VIYPLTKVEIRKTEVLSVPEMTPDLIAEYEKKLEEFEKKRAEESTAGKKSEGSSEDKEKAEGEDKEGGDDKEEEKEVKDKKGTEEKAADEKIPSAKEEKKEQQ